MNDLMRERGAVIRSAATMLRHGEVDLESMPELVLRIIDEQMWRQRAIPEEEWRLSRKFNSFEEFVTSPPYEGMGTTIQMLKDVCHRNPKAVDAIVNAVRRPEGAKGHRTHDNISSTDPAWGTSQEQALRRLRDKRPDLHTRVLNRELSAHAAMLEAGFRRKTITVRVDDPASAARTLRRHFSADDLTRLIEELG